MHGYDSVIFCCAQTRGLPYGIGVKAPCCREETWLLVTGSHVGNVLPGGVNSRSARCIVSAVLNISQSYK